MQRMRLEDRMSRMPQDPGATGSGRRHDVPFRAGRSLNLLRIAEPRATPSLRFD